VSDYKNFFPLAPSQSKARASQNSFLHAALLFHCIVPKNQLHKKTGRARVSARTVPDHKSPSKKGNVWLTPILAAQQKTPAAYPNPFIYDLLNRLNASFARVHSNMAALEAVGIFDPLMMQNLNRQSEQLRAGANYHLLGAMRRVEERDRDRFSQTPGE